MVGGGARHRRDRAGLPLPDAGACDGPAAALDRPRHAAGEAASSSCGRIRGWSRCRPTAARWCSRTDHARTVEAIRAHSSEDAATLPRSSAATLERLGAFLLPTPRATPPSLDGPAPGEMWELLKTGRRFRELGRQDGFRLLRWMPMAVADLVAEWFSTDLLQAAVAARGNLRQRGRALVGRHRRGAPPQRGDGSRRPAAAPSRSRAGPARSLAAMAEAAREAGATIRVDARGRAGAGARRPRHRRPARGRIGGSRPTPWSPTPIRDGPCSISSIRWSSIPVFCSGCATTACPAPSRR